ncbi:hypothetical protein H102_04170 [Trichophyton rubrum CBS 100081]|nr:hypothetical protein H102_04170 [Trichophyton rubrum CBS 100081]
MINLVHERQLLAATHNGVTSYVWHKGSQSFDNRQPFNAPAPRRILVYWDGRGGGSPTPGRNIGSTTPRNISSRPNAQYDVTQQHSLKIWRRKKKKEGKKALVPCGDATHRLAFTSGEDFGSRMNPTYSICPFRRTIKARLLRL